VFVDEAQNAPALFMAVQHLYDGDKQRWRFILAAAPRASCGRPARTFCRDAAFSTASFPSPW